MGKAIHFPSIQAQSKQKSTKLSHRRTSSSILTLFSRSPKSQSSLPAAPKQMSLLAFLKSTPPASPTAGRPLLNIGPRSHTLSGYYRDEEEDEAEKNENDPPPTAVSPFADRRFFSIDDSLDTIVAPVATYMDVYIPPEPTKPPPTRE